MDFHVNKAILQRDNIRPDVAFYLASLYFECPFSEATFNAACTLGFLEYDGFDLMHQPVNLRLTQKGIDLIEKVFLDSEFKEEGTALDRYDRLADKLRELYPKGRKEGTAYMWRDSRAVIAKKLKTLVKKYDFEFTDEQAINATKKYIDSFNGNYSYMQLLKYFILKRNNETGEEVSQLMSYIENEDCTDAANDDWMNEVR